MDASTCRLDAQWNRTWTFDLPGGLQMDLIRKMTIPNGALSMKQPINGYLKVTGHWDSTARQWVTDKVLSPNRPCCSTG